MNIEIEVSMETPQRDFAELRRELIERGDKFNATNLCAIPYSQLHLCCIGNAASAACHPRLVQHEKANRRERFLNMEYEEFKEAERYLKIEQMYDDVMYAISKRIAPKYDSLSECQKLWVKLTCLYNHTDNPSARMQEAIALFLQCAEVPDGLPVDICKTYAGKLKGISSVYPGRISDETFREKVGEMAETVLQFLPVEERKVIEKEQLQDFSCTSDCFKVLV
jgi:hypothetical protein